MTFPSSSRTRVVQEWRFINTLGVLTSLNAIGQIGNIAAIPVLTRLYSAEDLGLFLVYLSVVNIGGPMASLRYEAAMLYAKSRAEIQGCAKLALMSAAATGVIALIGGLILASTYWRSGHGMVLLMAVGIVALSVDEVIFAWCLRHQKTYALGMGRCLIPLIGAMLQISVAPFAGTAEALAGCTIVSQVGVGVLLALHTMKSDVLGRIASTPLAACRRCAATFYRCPAFDVPATLAGYASLHLPNILLGTAFGTAFAAEYGIANRLLTAPVVLICLPLSNIVTAHMADRTEALPVLAFARRAVYFAFFAVSLPLILSIPLLPQIFTTALGHSWKAEAPLLAMIALASAFQAIATPLQQVPVTLGRQEYALLVDTSRAVLALGPAYIAATMGASGLACAALITGGAAAGYLLKTVVALRLLHWQSRVSEMSPSGPTPSPLPSQGKRP